MDTATIGALTRLFLDTRMLCAQGDAPPDRQFADALPLLGDTRADAWMRYCCQTLRELVRTDRRKAYDFADAVHNTRYVQGLEYGALLWARRDWEIDVEPFRERYGAAYFQAFTDCVFSRDEVDRRFLELAARKKLH